MRLTNEVLQTGFGAVDLYRSEDRDDRVLMLHACGAGAKPLQKLALSLAADRFQIIIPNLAGYGGSFHNDKTLGPIEQHLEIIDYLLTQATTRYRIIGHSMGGFLALRAALLWPDKVSSVTAIEPMAFGVLDTKDDADALAADRNVIAVLNEALEAQQPDRGLAAFIGFWNDTSWTDLPASMQTLLCQLSEQINTEATAVSYNPTPAAVYSGLEQPVQLIVSERAPLPARRIVERLQEIIPQAEQYWVAGAGHMGPLTHPDKFARLISRFLI